jgi:hypothetical protein
MTEIPLSLKPNVLQFHTFSKSYWGISKLIKLTEMITSLKRLSNNYPSLIRSLVTNGKQMNKRQFAVIISNKSK